MNKTYIIGNTGNITIYWGGEEFVVSADHIAYKEILDILYDQNATVQNLKDIYHYGNVIKDLESYVTMTNSGLDYQGYVVDNLFVKKILEYHRQGLSYDHLITFFEALSLNPSARAGSELFKFLSHNHIPITSRGTFVGYKGVRSDYFSLTAGKMSLLSGTQNKDGRIYNGVGEYIECPRNQVNDDPNQTCSFGLHVGSYDYAKSFGPQLVLVEVHPKDVVSIPVEYNGKKLRACVYRIIGDASTPLPDYCFDISDYDSIQNESEDYNDDYDYDYDDDENPEDIDW